MKREISPVIAILAIVTIVALAGGIYFYFALASTTQIKPEVVNAQSSKKPIPQQSFIPKATGQ